MENSKMFCFQCEQTAGGTGCKGNAGVCGKTADVAKLQNKLTGALIGLARIIHKNDMQPAQDTWKLIIKGLFTTVTNVNFNNQTIQELIQSVQAQKRYLPL